MALLKQTPVYLHNSNKHMRFWQNSASTMRILLTIKVLNFS